METHQPAHRPWLQRQRLVATLVVLALLVGAALGAVVTFALQHTNQSALVGLGCPLPTETSTVSPSPTLVVLYNPPSTPPAPVSLQVSQSLEVKLYGAGIQAWHLFTPDVAPVLAQETPAGAGDATGQSCVWRFSARQAGVEHLEFFGNKFCEGTARTCAGYLFKLTVIVTSGT